MKKIKKGNLNFDQSGRAYPDNPKINENWNCIWENNGKYYKLVGDNAHKEWEEVDMFNQIIGDAYKRYYDYMRDDRQWELDKDEFINKVKTNDEFAKKWGLRIEERELSEDERLKLVPNSHIIIEDVNSFANIENRTIKDFLDELNMPTKLITITYNNETIESYE